MEIKQLPGLGAPTTAPQVATVAPSAAGTQARIMLTKRSMDVLLRVERMMETATRALADAPATTAPARGAAAPASSSVATAEGSSRGN